jgi:hypothetical protein
LLKCGIEAIPVISDTDSDDIMRSFKVWPIAAGLVASCATILPAAAQQGNNAPPPPQMEKLEEGQEPAVTIRKPGEERKIEEKRAPGGKVKEVKVTKGKNTYYLKPNDPAGSAQPGDQEAAGNRAAQWEVMEFDLGRRKTKEGEQPEPAAPAAPPAQPANKK